VDPVLTELLTELPAISLLGPRASGKTTTAARHARSIVRLDRPAEAAAFHADADAALKGLAEPILLDEWQEVPHLLAAVKRAVDTGPRHPGRFLLTGSVRADLDAATWPGTGRVIDVAMMPLTIREQHGDASARPFLDRLTEADPGFPTRIDGPDLRGYLELALAGGFPEPALTYSPAGRRRWYTGYIRQLTTRDATTVAPGRDPVRLRRFLSVLAYSTAGVAADKTLYDAASIDHRTAAAYEQLLANLFILDALPAWFTNQIKRTAKASKRYLIDSGLAAALMGASLEGILRDGNLLGRIIDTFVVAQLRAELPVAATEPLLYHLRELDGGHEIDLVIEYGAHWVVGIEIKASAAPTAHDARHLVWLRDKLGTRFLRGVILHTGVRCWAVDERIHAIPIAALWT